MMNKVWCCFSSPCVLILFLLLRTSLGNKGKPLWLPGSNLSSVPSCLVGTRGRTGGSQESLPYISLAVCFPHVSPSLPVPLTMTCLVDVKHFQMTFVSVKNIWSLWHLMSKSWGCICWREKEWMFLEVQSRRKALSLLFFGVKEQLDPWTFL